MQLATHTQDAAVRLRDVLEHQKASFLADGTPDLARRLDRLKRLETMLLRYEDNILDVLSEDFQGRSRVLTRAADIVGGITAIRYTMDNLEHWMQPQPVALPQFIESDGTNAAIHYQPVGVVGAVIPWNGPILLSCLALIGILGAGNRAMIKPSEFAPATSALLARMIAATFDPAEVCVIEGASDVAAAFTRLPFDHLLFTGSTAIGRHVMRAAADNLVPVTLELGGKSPVIYGQSASLAEAAPRIAQGKLAFGGQVCVTPDYVLAPAKAISSLAETILAEAVTLYPTIHDNDDYTAIINDHHMRRLVALIDDARAKGATILTAHCGDNDVRTTSRKFPLTVILDATDDMDVMKDEIFGPILPILPYESMTEALAYVRRRPNPLAAYYFGDDPAEQARVTRDIHTGGLVINDVLCQIFYEQIPFGGSGASGMGRYRGIEGFKTFSNAVSVLTQKQGEDTLRMQRPPYGVGISGYLDSQLEAFRKS